MVGRGPQVNFHDEALACVYGAQRGDSNVLPSATTMSSSLCFAYWRLFRQDPTRRSLAEQALARYLAAPRQTVSRGDGAYLAPFEAAASRAHERDEVPLLWRRYARGWWSTRAAFASFPPR